MLKSRFVTAALFAIASYLPQASANWQVDPTNSDVQFVSIKKNTIAETHHFTQFAGALSSSGELQFVIDLASAETLIPIRNERLQKMLFETSVYPKATLTASLGEQLKGLKEGPNTVNVEATLALHGKSQGLTLGLNVFNLGNDLFVTNRLPIVINAKDFALESGIEALRQVAGLDSIAHAVPVTISLHFTAK
ncbi:hypothetical protein PALB_35980 [Pseudoalteromonas luteoviolacea B = ATCC 29581]|nr:hypothetical protein PALB_35980 [Pseudoalteromonas luteoviolacea B = ATCC 29581]